VAGTSVSWLIQLQDALNDQFNAVGTYKVETFELGTIYSNVPLDPETGLPLRTTSSMWAVNISGRGIRLASSLASSGQWNWKTFITGASVTADCINAGTMRADRIRAGLLTDQNGRNTWDLTNGTLRTNYMTANNISATGTLTSGTDTGYKARISGGEIQFYYNNHETIELVSIPAYTDGNKGGYLQACNGATYLGLRAPKLYTAENTSQAGTIGYTGTQRCSYYELDGEGHVGLHYRYRLAFINGICIGSQSW